MRIFEESQSFRQWWLFLGLGLVLTGLTVALFREQTDLQELESTGLLLIAIPLVVVISILLFSMKLHTHIDKAGISVRWKPVGILNKHFRWDDMEECYVRTYSPIREYGGWGLRGSSKNRAWNVSGNSGIQIVMKSGKKFLIGTHEPESAKKVISRYFPRMRDEAL